VNDALIYLRKSSGSAAVGVRFIDCFEQSAGTYANGELRCDFCAPYRRHAIWGLTLVTLI
jgi:hypothetical protein